MVIPPERPRQRVGLLSATATGVGIDSPVLRHYDTSRVVFDGTGPVTLPDQPLQRSGLRSLHEQVSDRLRQYASRGAVGTRLPSEEELVDLYGVSRVTIRRAVDSLVREGLVVRQRGRGTFISRRSWLRSWTGGPFKDEAGISTKLLDTEWVTGTAVPVALRPSSRRALVFHRLYLRDGAAHALVRVALPESIGSSLQPDRIQLYPLYYLLENDLGRIPNQARLSIGSAPAGSALARTLAVQPGSQLLTLQRTTVDAAENVLEQSTHYLLPEFFRFDLTVSTDTLQVPIFLPWSADEGDDDDLQTDIAPSFDTPKDTAGA